MMTNLTAQRKPAWVQIRHTWVRNILYWPLYLYITASYHVRIGRVPGNQQYFILFNHQTAWDQFLVSLSFQKHVYYVASEDLFSIGLVSRLISWLVAPIPFRKSTADIVGVKNCIRIAREGGSVAMALEGNRTYSGATEHIKSSVAGLVKKLGLPLVLYRIEGGYGVQPRWSDCIRKGSMRAYAARILQPEEYRGMSNEALFDLIQKELYVDERQDKTRFYSKKSAEYLDRAMYVCPVCGLSEFVSKGDTITCKGCGRQIRYLPDKTLEGVGFTFPYRYVKDWYDAQERFVHQLDLSPYTQTPIYTSTVRYSENIYCKKKRLIDKAAELEIYADRFQVTAGTVTQVYPFTEVSGATVLGRNKLNIYAGRQTFQFHGDSHFNALKYLNLYYHAVHGIPGSPDFLGL